MEKNVVSNQKGTIFLTTMVCMFLMIMIGGYIFKVTTQDAYLIARLKNSQQAQQLAEAGLGRAFSTITTNWNNINNGSNFPLTTLSPGTYDASVTQSGGRTLVSSLGTANGIPRSVSAEVTGPGKSALDYVFAAGGNASIDSGTGQSPGSITGDIYAAGNVNLDGPSSGGSLTVTGNVDAGGNITSSSSVTLTGTSTPQYTQSVPFPTVDWSYYQAIAVANGQYISGNKSYTAASPIPSSPPGGVIYVTGNITMVGTQSTTATIIANGNISINKSGSTYPRITVTAPTVSGVKYPAIMCQGNFTFSSTGNGGAYLTVNGLIYPQGNFNFTSGNNDTMTVTGSILARGDITVSPTAQNTVTADYLAMSPPGFSVSVASTGIVSYNS